MHLIKNLLIATASHCVAVAAFSGPSITAPRHLSPDCIDDLHAWADDQGIYRQVAVQDEPLAGGGRGLVAMRDLAPGEIAARVPLSATIRVGATDDINQDDNWAGVLAAKLCHEDSLGEDSAFWEYMQVGLPVDSPRTICRWSSSERLALQNDVLVNESFENAAWRRRQFTNCRDRDEFADMSSTKFLHYLDLVCSRTLKGRDGSRNLVPLIDNANHCPTEAGGGAFMCDIENDSICLIAGNRGFKAGEAVTLDYGGRRSDDYLLHYGFVPERCPSDSISVPVNGDEVRVHWDDCRSYGGHADDFVRSACSSLLLSFETTLGEDIELLREVGSIAKSAKNEEALRSALNYRIAKKSLLSQAAGVRASATSFSAFR